MFAADFDERLGLIICEEEDYSASRPKHDPPCRVAVGGHIDGKNNERGVDEPGAGVDKGIEKGEDKSGSSKVPRNMNDMEQKRRSKNPQTS